MNHTLAAMYNTNGYTTAAQRQQIKVAHLENFAKVAAMSGFDLSNMSPQDVNALYAEYRQKVAEEGGESPEEEAREEGEEEREEEEEEREEEERKEAQAAFLRAREFQEKVAEADHLGRVMAHAMWNETAAIKTAGPVGDKLRGAAAQVGGYARGAYKDARDAVKNKLRRPEPMKLLKEPGMSTAKKVGLGVAGAAALGGAGYAGYKHFKNKNKDSEGSSEENKEASARSFDMQAARQAVKLAHAAGWDADEAATRLEALMTLGAPAAEKVAHALGSFEEARDVRALELLEAGGYPVDWDQVFG